MEGLEFDLDDQLLKVQKSDIDHDQELLQIQRRKSTPKVVIEEYVQVDEDQPKKLEETKDSDDQIMSPDGDGQTSKRPHKLLTHIEIEDVSIAAFLKAHIPIFYSFLTQQLT